MKRMCLLGIRIAADRSFGAVAMLWLSWLLAGSSLHAQIDLTRNPESESDDRPSVIFDLPPEFRAKSRTSGKNQTQPASAQVTAYLVMPVLVQDHRNLKESAQTVERLIDLFGKHKLQGQFHLTAAVVQGYAQQFPQVLVKLKESGMGVGYLIRPPHPLYPGFTPNWDTQDSATLSRTLQDYETFALDLRTGQLDRQQPGGYQLLRKLLGPVPSVMIPPVAVRAAPTTTVAASNRKYAGQDDRIIASAIQLYRDLGVKLVMTDPLWPGQYAAPVQPPTGLGRWPVNLVLGSWRAPGERWNSWWWNRIDTPKAMEFDPLSQLNSHVQQWKGVQPMYVLAPISEHDFYRRGLEPWTLAYYSDKDKSHPLKPPYRTAAGDASTSRTAAERQKVWDAYESLLQDRSGRIEWLTAASVMEMMAPTVNHTQPATTMSATRPASAPSGH